MINSNERKLTLSGWLRTHNPREYDSPLKLQKFLLFYELFTKTAGEQADFDHLKGYKRGPVFSNVWGDYTKERISFNKAIAEAYSKNQSHVENIRARKSAFIVSILSEHELSELSHKLNLWNSKRDRIMGGEYQVTLDEADFNEDDARMVNLLDAMYPNALIVSSIVLPIDQYSFVFSSENISRLKESDMDILSALAETGDLHNPVYVEIDKDGRLVID